MFFVIELFVTGDLLVLDNVLVNLSQLEWIKEKFSASKWYPVNLSEFLWIPLYFSKKYHVKSLIPINIIIYEKGW